MKNIIIITQNDPFYLANNLNYLLNKLIPEYNVVGCVVSDVSPFGKKETFIEKSLKTLRIFGIKFFVYYSLKFVISKVFYKSVKKTLIKKNINLIKIKGSINSSENLKIISSYKPELLISILGNQIFKRKLLDIAPNGCINLHTALLPKYRGLMPTFWVLKNDETFTGVSVFLVDEGIDSGPILVQKKIRIGNLNHAQLIKKTKKIGMDCIIEAVKLIKSDNFELIPNPDEKKSYFSFPSKKDVIEFKMKGKKFF